MRISISFWSAMMAAVFAGTVHAQTLSTDLAKPLPKNNVLEGKKDTVNLDPILQEALAPQPERFRPFTWVSADYTLSWISRPTLPALVTTSSPIVAQADAGILGRSFTSVLLGEGTMGTGLANGMRVNTGVHLMEGLTFEVTGFFMLGVPSYFNASGDGSAGSTTIARPFFEPITGQEAAQLVAFPNRFAGSIDVSSRTTVWGIDGMVFEKFDLGFPIVLGVGFRYANLGDSFQVQQNTVAVSAPGLTFNGNTIPLSDSVRITDSFRTHNEFIGPQFNLRYQQDVGRFKVEVLGKVALGTTRQTVVIAGQSDHLSTGGVVLETANGGFLAAPSNIGSRTSNAFSVVPEVNLKLGYNVTRNFNLFASYDFLAWTNVARAAEQIDRSVNLTQVPTAAVFNPNFGGPSNPAPLFRTSDVTIHSLRLGFEWKF